jgi:uncharacterized protein YecA (UPF0149 family)
MTKVQDRNARCHCGSGKKYKNCHGAENAGPGRKIPMGYVIGGVAVLAVAGFILLRQTGGSKSPGGAPPGKVWSAEHGHWHDAP